MRPSSRILRLRRPALLAALLAALAGGGCDESFEPIAASPYRFSVWGYLDAAADTQWIRVMPVRPLAEPTGEPFDATVSLEHLGTGQRIVLRDSVFDLPTESGATFPVHNFWTAEPLEPGATYRFTADRPGGPPATADIRLPPEFDAELLQGQLPGAGTFFRLLGVDHVAFFEETLRVTTECGITEVNRRLDPDSVGADGEAIVVTLFPIILARLCEPATATGWLWAVGSADPWPDPLEYAPGVLGDEIERQSNIENALGFLGGVFTRRFPYQMCELVDPEAEGVPPHCRIRYGGDVASLVGTVRETGCGDGTLEEAVITVQEVEGEPPGARKIRRARSNFAGDFQIRSLDPGVRSEVTVRGAMIDLGEGPVAVHTVFTDTLELAPREERRIDVELERTDCVGGS